jgi:ABC-type transporter Mla MlaB component
MNPGNIEVSEIHSPLPPDVQEAAVRYANGDSPGCEAALTRSLSEPHANADPLPWLMLFELYRLQARWADFDQCAKRYASTFGKPAPEWIMQDAAAENLPRELREGGTGYCALSGELGSGSAAQAEAISRAAGQGVVHIDLSKVERVLPEGCELLSAQLRLLIASSSGVVFSGMEQLEKLLRAATEATPNVGSYWRLLLDLYQLQGAQRQFETTALEYALSVETEPPKWESVVMPVLAPTWQGERREEPRYIEGSEAIFLRGEMAGAQDPQLAGLRKFARNRHYVNINLSRLNRIDFVCAANLANTVVALSNLGKVVRLIRPSHLVGTLCQMLNMQQSATFIDLGTGA